MTPQRIEFAVYLVGVFLLGLAYHPSVKGAFEPHWLFYLAAAAWLVFLRVGGRALSRKLSSQ